MTVTRPKKKSTPKKKRPQTKQPSTDPTFSLFLGFFCLLIFLALKPPTIQGPIASDSPQAFFEAMAPAVQKELRGTGLYPSVVLAQAVLESDYGRSLLAHDYHNYFGIKASGRGPQVTLPTTEYLDGQWHAPQEPFRVYPSPAASVKDYVALMQSLDRYQPVLQAQSPQEAAWALQGAGYATDPAYAAKVIQIIADYQLEVYDP